MFEENPLSFNERADIIQKYFNKTQATDPETGFNMNNFQVNISMRLFELFKEIKETATAGATSSGSIASIPNPHLSPGKARGKKSYIGNPMGGRSGTKAPPQPVVKQPKKSDGTAKNALDMKNSIFGENPIRR